MASSVCLSVGTHKGGFLLRSDPARGDWKREGPFFRGTDVNHLLLDVRGEPTLFACVNSAWFGSGVHWSRDWGADWEQAEQDVRFPEGSERKVEKIWCVIPGAPGEPEVLYAGVAPAALFQTRDGGRHWAEVESLAQHPTREKWSPGAGGLMVHSICPHPLDTRQLHVAISAAGTFSTEDGGESWEPRNQGVLADFLPEKYPQVGQCVHHLTVHPGEPELLYQQNHCGVYRSEDAGRKWIDISEGLPSRFGFPLVVNPHDPDTIYVVPEESPEFRCPVGAAFAVYRSRDRGDSWERLDRGLPGENAYLQVYRQAMCTDDCHPAGIYVGTSTGQIFCSRDEGDNWELMADFLPPVYSLHAVTV